MDLKKSNPIHSALLNVQYLDRLENNILNSSNDIPVEIQIKRINDLRNFEYEAHYLDKIIYTPVYAPMIKLIDTLTIFNHPESQIEFYSYDDSLVKIVPITYNSIKRWDEQIIADEDFFKAYAVFKHSGIFELREINLQNGNLGTSNKLYFPFVKNVKIRSGYVYFIYKDYSTWSKTKLYKQRLTP